MTTILAALDRHARERPDAPALDARTYAELQAASHRVARHLMARGIKAGDRVAIYSENRPGFVFALLGIWRAGATAVPTNVLYRSGDLEHVLTDADARAVCVSEASAPFVSREVPRTIIALSDVERWALDDSDDSSPSKHVSSADDLALLIYTSGTTGRSKGAMLTHGNLATIAAQLAEAWGWTGNDTLLLTLPLFHVHGLGAGLNGTLYAGGRVRLRERFDAADAIAALARGDASMFFGVPTMYVRILEHAPEGTRFDAVRLFVSGSAALPASVHQRFEQRFGASVLERYGSTEFGFALSNPLHGRREPGHVGFPLPGVEVQLVDGDGAPVSVGEPGEIVVHGANVFRGYWRNEEATAKAFWTDASGKRWYRSGDVATFDPVRGVKISGRIKELIISGGFNIYPAEVEFELLNVPGVRAAAVVGQPHEARGEIPVAFVEADAGFDPESAIETLRNRIASFKVPRAVHVIDALPRNAMGKVEKPRLRQLLTAA